jgi:flavin reductase (DIM6/NTAB) family NADH-FMN oxidoreductase RutF
MVRPEVTTADFGKMLCLNPAEHLPQNIYKLMVGCVVPRPIAFVSSIDEEGIYNLAPFSYFTAVCAQPPTVLFCPLVRMTTGRKKDTLRNVLATKEFVINVVSAEIVPEMNQTAAEVEPEVDEFALAGLTPIPSEIVKPPRVAESPVHMECRLREIVTISDQPGGGSIVIGEVVRFHVREELVDNYRIDPDKLNAVGRMGGPTYCHTKDRFNLERPK